MDDQTKELIAVGASVSAHCQPCLAYHIAKARELGLDECTIREAIGVGHQVEKGVMVAMKQFSEGVFHEPIGKTPEGCKGRESKPQCS